MATTKPQPVNPPQVRQFLADAQKKAAAARKTLAIDEEIAHQTAYQAMLKGSLALMLSHGQRPRAQLGQHIAIIDFARRRLDPAHAPLLDLFDRMRRKRNTVFYDIAIISDVEAEEAVRAAGTTCGSSPPTSKHEFREPVACRESVKRPQTARPRNPLKTSGKQPSRSLQSISRVLLTSIQNENERSMHSSIPEASCAAPVDQLNHRCAHFLPHSGWE